MHNALHDSEVRPPEIIHVETYLLDSIGNLGAGKHQVLEGPSEALVQSWISNGRPRLGSDLGLCVYERQNWPIVYHSSTLKDIKSILVLSEKGFARLMLYGGPQKVMEGSEVLHGDFPLEGRYGVLQKCCAGCGEDNAINVK
jgi:hypothetical protein